MKQCPWTATAWPMHLLRTRPIVRVAERVTSLRVLGVVIPSDRGLSGYLDQVLSCCASSFYALRVLLCHGLPTPKLQEVARSSTITSVMCASPSWWDSTSVVLKSYRAQLELLINKFKHCGSFSHNFCQWCWSATFQSGQYGCQSCVSLASLWIEAVKL